jgi:hypothetical protein
MLHIPRNPDELDADSPDLSEDEIDDLLEEGEEL